MTMTLLLTLVAVGAIAIATGCIIHVRSFEEDVRERRLPRTRRWALEEGAAMLRRRAFTKRPQNIHSAIEDEQCAAALEHLAKLDPAQLEHLTEHQLRTVDRKLFGETDL